MRNRLKLLASISILLGIPVGIGLFITRSEPWSIWRTISIPILGAGAVAGIITGIFEAIGLVAAIIGACLFLWTRTGRGKWFWIGVASSLLVRFVPFDYIWWSLPLLLLALWGRDEKIREKIVDTEIEREPETPVQALFNASDSELRMRQIALRIKKEL
jgi:hypothetical protein